jgi:hypothetical protein
VVSNTLYVFIDESGNFDFSKSGTRHFVMAALVTSDPLGSAAIIHSLRYKLLAEGRDVSMFHASEDRQEIRDQMFRSFNSVRGANAHIVHCDKSQLSERFQTDSRLHAICGRTAVNLALSQVDKTAVGSVVVILDQALPQKKQGEFKLAVAPILKRFARPFHIYFQRMAWDANGQIADYLAWSKFVLLERAEERPWRSVVSALVPTDSNVLDKLHQKNDHPD